MISKTTRRQQTNKNNIVKPKYTFQKIQIWNKTIVFDFFFYCGRVRMFNNTISLEEKQQIMFALKDREIVTAVQ